MKAYAKKLADLSMIEQKYLKAIENIGPYAAALSEQHSEEESKDQNNIVHITATALASPQQTLPQSSSHPPSQGQRHQESLDFRPDPNFLLKINQNMLLNDERFGQNNNQPPKEHATPLI